MAAKQRTTLPVAVARIEQKLDDMLNKLDRHIEQDNITQQRILDGLNGYGDTPGIQARIHTLEDRANTTRWHFRSIYTSLVGFALAAGAATFWPR